ncbi:isochorismatase family protein [soil metagenome]
MVVIDMQGVFGEPGSPWFTPGYPRIVRSVDELVTSFGDRVVFTRFVLPERPEGSWIPYYRRWHAVTTEDARSLFDLTEPWARMRLQTLDKHTFSKWGPELKAEAGPGRTLVLCGVSTDCCVISTAVAAADAGMFVRIVSDACAGVDEAAHEAALRVASGYAPQIEVTTVAEELARGVPAA